ncbi:hypothetical protein SNEBB_004135 [Seison nebaliae]|nr:hypothetical protein SNEBB_004135 [Seison nebaliae]
MEEQKKKKKESDFVPDWLSSQFDIPTEEIAHEQEQHHQNCRAINSGNNANINNNNNNSHCYHGSKMYSNPNKNNNNNNALGGGGNGGNLHNRSNVGSSTFGRANFKGNRPRAGTGSFARNNDGTFGTNTNNNNNNNINNTSHYHHHHHNYHHNSHRQFHYNEGIGSGGHSSGKRLPFLKFVTNSRRPRNQRSSYSHEDEQLCVGQIVKDEKLSNDEVIKSTSIKDEKKGHLYYSNERLLEIFDEMSTSDNQYKFERENEFYEILKSTNLLLKEDEYKKPDDIRTLINKNFPMRTGVHGGPVVKRYMNHSYFPASSRNDTESEDTKLTFLHSDNSSHYSKQRHIPPNSKSSIHTSSQEKMEMDHDSLSKRSDDQIIVDIETDEKENEIGKEMKEAIQTKCEQLTDESKVNDSINPILEFGEIKEDFPAELTTINDQIPVDDDNDEKNFHTFSQDDHLPINEELFSDSISVDKTHFKCKNFDQLISTGTNESFGKLNENRTKSQQNISDNQMMNVMYRMSLDEGNFNELSQNFPPINSSRSMNDSNENYMKMKSENEQQHKVVKTNHNVPRNVWNNPDNKQKETFNKIKVDLLLNQQTNRGMSNAVVMSGKKLLTKMISSLPDDNCYAYEWFYIDPKTVIHGPYNRQTMIDWFDGKYFTADLPCKRGVDDKFYRLYDYCVLWKTDEKEKKNPFYYSEYPPIIEGNCKNIEKKAHFYGSSILEKKIEEAISKGPISTKLFFPNDCAIDNFATNELINELKFNNESVNKEVESPIIRNDLMDKMPTSMNCVEHHQPTEISNQSLLNQINDSSNDNRMRRKPSPDEFSSSNFFDNHEQHFPSNLNESNNNLQTTFKELNQQLNHDQLPIFTEPSSFQKPPNLNFPNSNGQANIPNMGQRYNFWDSTSNLREGTQRVELNSEDFKRWFLYTMPHSESSNIDEVLLIMSKSTSKKDIGGFLRKEYYVSIKESERLALLYLEKRECVRRGIYCQLQTNSGQPKPLAHWVQGPS